MAAGYRRLQITDRIVDRALERAARLPVFDYSHRAEQANFVGCLGEIAFELLLERQGLRFEDATASTEYDYVVEDRFTVDVKTKDRTVLPRIHYDNSVPIYNHEHQRPDFYYFVSLLRDVTAHDDDPHRFTLACLLGGISLIEFEKGAIRWETGQVDVRNGTRFWTSCLNIQMSKLMSNEAFFAAVSSPANR